MTEQQAPWWQGWIAVALILLAVTWVSHSCRVDRGEVRAADYRQTIETTDRTIEAVLRKERER